LPFVSRQQAKWAFTPTGKKALGGLSNVKEWETATDYSKLPEKKKPGAILSGWKKK
jgi:hypothetical protein